MEQVKETVSDVYQPPAPHFSSQHLFHWCQCTQCPWVLSTLEFGYRLQFKSKPPQFQGIVPTVLREEMQYRPLKDEVSVLGQGFYSTYFLIPKKDGDLRPILNLRKFNHHLRRLPFRMLCLSTLLTFSRQGYWFTTVDLQDAYFHIPIHKDQKKYLRFYFQGNAYEYNVLPFGLSLAPRTFTNV